MTGHELVPKVLLEAETFPVLENLHCIVSRVKFINGTLADLFPGLYSMIFRSILNLFPFLHLRQWILLLLF